MRPDTRVVRSHVAGRARPAARPLQIQQAEATESLTLSCSDFHVSTPLTILTQVVRVGCLIVSRILSAGMLRESRRPGSRAAPEAPQLTQPSTRTELDVSLYRAIAACIAGGVADVVALLSAAAWAE